ncbi:MATE family efflux transporter [Neolewinella lacunae]|uniref:MATE family efflux transporter n=1 Tax=Neolewinella lacunae TaxID=1517758 RepID=A0A923PJR0_9BACT|nr:MATE family efflux transporter [Neolewinella lacunae]MBC6995325.1 MATE family efflux transporter [Neolewinella lacunae]MDN3633037.1 MATE family efflux transporter [Neolewinella lacunae]
MKLTTSYRDIWKVSLPIIIGSAAQNVVAMTDSVFLYYKGEEDFAAIGFVSTFYIIVAAIGFGFSRGGQILMARRSGQKQPGTVGRTFYSTVYFELVLAALLFLFMTYGSYWLFASLVDSDIIFYKSLEYLETRKWGVFASYLGVACIALYTGIARPTFIIVDTFILAITNIFLDRALIFGMYGFPEMGIAGAGLASTIAEYVALLVFLVYMAFDKKNRIYNIFKLPKWDPAIIKDIIGISVPIVAMSVVGLGSAFVFFGLVDNFGERALAVTNIVRIVYLILSVPAWGFCTGINTMASYFVGAGKPHKVKTVLWKTSLLCLVITTVLIMPLLIFPTQVLYPILGDERAYLIEAAYPVFWVLWGILTTFSFGSIFFNGLIGAGETGLALGMQFACAIGYVILIFVVVRVPWGTMVWAWSVEMLYWIALFILSLIFFRRPRWRS